MNAMNNCCYICLCENIKDPIDPAGCGHYICRDHLKVRYH